MMDDQKRDETGDKEQTADRPKKAKAVAAKKAKLPARQSASVKQMDLFLDQWPDRVRGIPNLVLRSALFSIVQKREVYKKFTLIASNEDIEIRQKGEQFNQEDLDVWQELVHRAREHALGTTVRFTVNSILEELDKDKGGAQHNQLAEAIGRLMGGVIEIRWTKEGKKMMDSFVKKSYYDEETETYVLILSKDLLQIYQAGYTQIDSQERKLFRKNKLAQWLHGFYSSHAIPYDFKVETLKARCGSKTKRLTDFRTALKVALELLVSHGALISAEIDPDRDVVKVKRVPSESQKRHLARKAEAAQAAQIAKNNDDFNNPNTPME